MLLYKYFGKLYKKKHFSFPMSNLTLYQFEECPFCAKVRSALEKLKAPYRKVNVPRNREDPLRKKLFQESGVPTVPVLEIDGRFIGDSEDIVKYLEGRFGGK